MKDFFERYAQYIMPEPNTGCWLWIGATTRPKRLRDKGLPGYGEINRDGDVLIAHRCAYEAVWGDGAADGLSVRHKCDTPPCCNPDHLELGTHADNMADMAARGRSATGEKNGQSVLSLGDAAAIKILSGSGIATKELASSFGVSASLVEFIRSGKRWTKDLAGTPNDTCAFFPWLHERRSNFPAPVFQKAERAAFVARYRHTIDLSADFRKLVTKSMRGATAELVESDPRAFTANMGEFGKVTE